MSAGPTEDIYLDNAATSWPKPETVLEAINAFYRDFGAAAHRGIGNKSSDADRLIQQCRIELSKFVNCNPDNTAFCFNGTDALNQAIFGLIESGDHVVTTDIEHNSTLRPLKELERRKTIKLDFVRTNQGMVDLKDLDSKVHAETKAIMVSLVSNVTGTIQRIDQVAEIAKRRDVLLMVDGAQALGHIAVDFLSMGADVLAASGHKGLLGPLGTGLLFFSDRAAESVQPLRYGGTGTESESIVQPIGMPQKT